MLVTIRHSGGESFIRAVSLREALHRELGLDVALESVERPGGAPGGAWNRTPAIARESGRVPTLDVVADGETIAWRRGGPLGHALGFGWPDEKKVIAALRARLAA